MKRVLKFFGWVVAIASIVASLYVTAAIFDAGTNHVIDTYFFQGNQRSADRPGVPVRPSELGEARMRDMLIRKFVNEYFYVIPDTANAAARVTPAQSSPLFGMALKSVFTDWTAGVGAEIQRLAARRVLRTVSVIGEITKPEGDDYWHVNYELKTWDRPNDMGAAPTITRGVMYISLTVTSKPDVVRSFGVLKMMETHRAPEAWFRFVVERVNIL